MNSEHVQSYNISKAMKSIFVYFCNIVFLQRPTRKLWILLSKENEKSMKSSQQNIMLKIINDFWMKQEMEGKEVEEILKTNKVLKTLKNPFHKDERKAQYDILRRRL